MIRINQIKLPIDHKEAALKKKIKKALHNTEYKQYKIVKRSIDARKKEELSYVYAVDVTLSKNQEEKFLKKNKNRNIMSVKEKVFEFPKNQREFEVSASCDRNGTGRTICSLDACKSRVKSDRLRTRKRRHKPYERCRAFLGNWRVEF